MGAKGAVASGQTGFQAAEGNSSSNRLRSARRLRNFRFEGFVTALNKGVFSFVARVGLRASGAGEDIRWGLQERWLPTKEPN
jgi:hypothetical protein